VPLQQADQVAEQIAVKFVAVYMYNRLPRWQLDSMCSWQM